MSVTIIQFAFIYLNSLFISIQDSQVFILTKISSNDVQKIIEDELNECLRERMSMSVRKMKRRRVIVVVTLLSLNAWLSCVIPASPIRLLLRMRWVSVCVSECRWVWERWRREEWLLLLLLLLCYLVMLDSALSFLHLQFDCCRGWGEWVSAWVNVNECEKDEEEKSDCCCCYFVVS